MLKEKWIELTHWGAEAHLPDFLKRELIITNHIALILLIVFLLSLPDPIVLEENILIGDVILSILICVLVLFLNKFGKYNVSRLLTCAFLLLLQFVAFISLGNIKPVYYDIFPFVIIGYLLFTLLIIDFDRERKASLPVLIFNFLLLIFHDQAFNYFNESPSYESGYLLYKSYQFFLWVVLLIMIIYLKRMNARSEEKLLINNNELQLLNEKNYENLKEISAQNEEIVSQNEELISQQDQLGEQQAFIEGQNQELKDYQDKLKKYIFRISKTKDLLAQREAENRSILNVLKRNFRTIVYDHTGKVINISPLVIGGLAISENDILGKNIHEVLGKYLVEPANLDFDSFWEGIINQEIMMQDFKFRHGEEESVFRATYSVIRDADDHISKVISISEDITSLIKQQSLIEEKNRKLEVQKREIEDKNEELEQQKEEIEAINETLEERVKERTLALERQNKQLAEYAFINAHMLRAPVSSILGLINLLNYEKLSEEEKEIFNYMSKSVNQLDNIVFKINKAIQQNTIIDRDFLNE